MRLWRVLECKNQTKETFIMAAKKSSDTTKKSNAQKLPKASAVAEKSAAKAPKKAEKKAPAKQAAKKKAAAKAEKKAPVAPKAAPKAAEAKKAAPSKPVYSPEQIYRMIEKEAYYIAERSGFQRSPQDCWVEAEATVQMRA
jgi:membrane protein involved in colicin uptake